MDVISRDKTQSSSHSRPTAPLTDRVSMLFDGGCPLCAKEVAHYQRIDREQMVNWVNIDQDSAMLKTIGIDKTTAMKHLHVVNKHGDVVKGAYAFATVWAELPRYRYLAKLVSVPGVLRILDKLYNVFAEKRFNRRVRCDSNVCS